VKGQRRWSGRFLHHNTNELLNLKPGRFSLDMFREKRWCYIGIIHPEIIFGCAVIHLGYIAGAFAFAFDRAQKKMTEYSFASPSFGQARHDRNPENGICSYKSLWGRLVLKHNKRDGKRFVKTEFTRPGRVLAADIEITDPENSPSPVHFLMETENLKHAVTTKTAGLKAKGLISVNRKRFRLNCENTFAVFDWTNGFFPRQTFWNWACGAGFAQDGTQVAFNFSRGVYEKGLLENIVWINGIPHETGKIIFTYDNKNPEQAWHVRCADKSVDLVFTPEGIRRASENFGIIQSSFIQPCGTFSGQIRIHKSSPYHLTRAGGVVEEHYAKW
jgi:hypothetical protein